MTTTRQPCTVAADLHRAAERMRALDAGLPAHDGVAIFNRVYLAVTDEITLRGAAGFFRNPSSASALAARFADRYLRAVDAAAAGERPPACWRPLFQQRRHPGVSPVQFALAGINAHVGHDLALAVVDTCASLACRPAALETDFERVGDVLAALEERIREDLMPGPDLLDVADPLTHLAGSWSLDRARDAAWAASRVLWGLRHTDGLYGEFAERLDEGVGLVGRFLLTPLG
ncbi:DUF5995 family protein [Streptomyces sp. NPDC051776]|uniref:DUF5995 family protein n=1 Tax=Streptomyces sp. NPDC051776 TaxID=3155414 RepID=UPI0034234E06